MIPKPMVRSVQTVHLSCIKISTISKRTKMTFLLSIITDKNPLGFDGRSFNERSWRARLVEKDVTPEVFATS
jgi:hypothetical protein